jgi:hypothetical protein
MGGFRLETEPVDSTVFLCYKDDGKLGYQAGRWARKDFSDVVEPGPLRTP